MAIALPLPSILLLPAKVAPLIPGPGLAPAGVVFWIDRGRVASCGGEENDPKPLNEFLDP